MHVQLHIPEPIGRPLSWWRRLPDRWPFLFWLGAVALAVTFYMHGGKLGGLTGTVVSDRQTVSPVEAGTLRHVYVRVGEKVKKGQQLAEMDTALLDAEMLVEQLQAQRQFGLAAQRAEQALREARIRQAEIEGERLVLEQEAERLDDLLAKQLVDAQTVARIKARLETLRRAAELYPELVAILERQCSEAKERQVALDQTLSRTNAPAGDRAVEAAVAADDVESRLNLLELRRSRYRFYAELDGTVSRVFHSPGETVVAGDPILVVIGDTVTGAEGFLPEATMTDVHVGMPAYISPASRLGPAAKARVVAVTPDVMALPARANPLPQRTLRGRRVMLVFEEEHSFLPGQSVAIQFERPLLTRLVPRFVRTPSGRVEMVRP